MAKRVRKVAGTTGGKAARTETTASGEAKGKAGKVSRSALTGRYVDARTAARHPRTSVTERTYGRIGVGSYSHSSVTPQTAARQPNVPETEQQPGQSDLDQAELDRVLARVRLVWAGNAAMTWMTSANARLGGSRPLDVLAVHGPDPVLEALEAAAWGGAS